MHIFALRAVRISDQCSGFDFLNHNPDSLSRIRISISDTEKKQGVKISTTKETSKKTAKEEFAIDIRYPANMLANQYPVHSYFQGSF